MSSSAPAPHRQHSSANAPATSTSAPPPKPQLNIHPTATIAEKALLIGPHRITIGEGAIVHPYARLRADHGEIVVGAKCIVAERAVVGLSSRVSIRKSGGDGVEGEGPANSCRLEDGVSVETNAVVEASRVGEYSTIEVNATVGALSSLGKWCRVGVGCKVREEEILDDFTVVFGQGSRRVDAAAHDRREVLEMRVVGKEKEVELLRSLVPDAKVKWSA